MIMAEKEIETIWSRAQTLLETKVKRASYETWIKTAEPVSYDNDIFILRAANPFAKEFLSTKFYQVIKDALEEILKQEVEIFITENAGEHPPAVKTDAAEKKSAKEKEAAALKALEGQSSSLQSRYTFQNFVVGSNNRMAHAASLAVAEAPAGSYNPLFLYGGVGLGKTHLMQAIGNYLLESNPRAKVTYLSSEQFINDFISHLRAEKMNEFRNKYRSCDLFLIDDIQFIEGKEAMQEEFFHTFNALHSAGKQIVISSDRPPKEIATLEDRLRSRFEWGLMTDIQPPDIETRIAILQMKAEAEKMSLDNEVLEFIASKFRSNIRELEGALIRVIAFASINNAKVDRKLAESVLGSHSPREISLERILDVVSDTYQIGVPEIKGQKRNKDISWARQVVMYLSRYLTDASTTKIGSYIGGRNHTTVLHSYEKVQKLCTSDEKINAEVTKIVEKIRNL